MATTTDSSTLAPSVNNDVGGTGEKGFLDSPRPVSPILDSEKRPVTPTTGAEKAVNPDAGSEGGSEGSEDGTQYPDTIALTLITTALSLAVFLVALDQTIIATAIPKITDQFGALSDVGWYGSSYMLTVCSFQLVYGKIYTFFSLKWVFLAAIGIFELGSLICGVAPDSKALIVGRAIAGLGCAGIFSGALIILAHSVPLRKRPMYTGLVGAMYGIASVAGPLMGGAFTDHATWRWCFYINLPIGAFTIGVLILYFTPPRAKADKLTLTEKLQEIDFVGTGLLLPGVVALLLALQWGGTTYKWGSGRIIGLLVTAFVLLVGFVATQLWRKEKATIPPRILKQRSIAFSSMLAFSIGSAFMLLVFYIPIWLQAIKSVSATKSGIMNLPLILGVVVLSILAGILITLCGYYTPFMIAGAAICAIGTGLLTTFEVDTGHAKWIGYQFICGAGIGLCMQQPMIAAQTVLKIEDVPTGTAVVVFFQTLGGALFISVGQNVFSNKLIEGLAESLPNIDPVAILNTGATSLKSTFPADMHPAIIKAYNHALIECFYPAVAIAVVGVIVSLGVEWESVKGKKVETVAGA
ncbi:MFS general substrate transporter [Tuber magnatum]|uniref:MFS general substrate transporter n=1 Tax=Tuber magnatum TaxID=42249 RepID=A0A317SPI4_9PEZI|nr:MFS general substrate transporter [Tuber magnatum]